MVELKTKSRAKNKEGKEKKRYTHKSAYGFHGGQELTLKQHKATQGGGLKILTAK